MCQNNVVVLENNVWHHLLVKKKFSRCVPHTKARSMITHRHEVTTQQPRLSIIDDMKQNWRNWFPVMTKQNLVPVIAETEVVQSTELTTLSPFFKQIC